jgi:hypothetical protein
MKSKPDNLDPEMDRSATPWFVTLLVLALLLAFVGVFLSK